MRLDSRRLARAAALATAVVALHAAVLTGVQRLVEPTPGPPAVSPATLRATSPTTLPTPASMVVRAVRPAPAQPVLSAAVPEPAPPAPRAMTRPPRGAAATPALLRPVAMQTALAGVDRPAPPAPPPPPPATRPEVLAQESEVALSPSTSRPAAGAEPVPTYPVRLPASFDRRYRISRGFLSGQGHFRWTRDEAGRYDLQLAGTVAGINVLDWVSRGEIDAAGVAPERFVVRRRGRDVSAANFQRAAGKINYSGPAVEFALPAGAQDRLSWMVQLPAVLEAAPQRGAVGERIVFFVSGARGDADVWQFVVEAQDRVAIGADDVPALRLVRQPRKPYDTRVEVWLAPSQHHLPVRARLSQEGGGDPLELVFDPD